MEEKLERNGVGTVNSGANGVISDSSHCKGGIGPNYGLVENGGWGRGGSHLHTNGNIDGLKRDFRTTKRVK